MIIIVILVLVGVWLLYVERNTIRLGWRSRSWPQTEGVIMEHADQTYAAYGRVGATPSKIGSFEFSERSFVYSYIVGGKMYRSDRYSFGFTAQERGMYFHVGDAVTVYYDPNDPAVSVLRRGIPGGALFGLFFLFLSAAYPVIGYLFGRYT